MSLKERVPSIDLSPEFIERPLAPGHWRDYFRLLSDMAYYPQRTRAYVADFARRERGERSAPRVWSPSAWEHWVEESPVQREFLLMTMVICAASVLVVTQVCGLIAHWLAGGALPAGAMGAGLIVGLFVAVGVLMIGVIGGESGALTPLALALSNALGLTIMASNLATENGARSGGVAFLVLAAAFFWGAASSVICASASVSVNSVRLQSIISLIVAAVLATAMFIAGKHVGDRTFFDFIWLMLCGMGGAILGSLRVDDYLRGRGSPGEFPTAATWQLIPRVTPIKLPYLHDHIANWFDHDWQRALDNVATIWFNTAQQETVHRALHEVMAGDRAIKPGKPAPSAKAGSSTPAPGALAANTAVPATPADERDRPSDWLSELIVRVVSNPTVYPWEMISWSESERPQVGWRRLRTEHKIKASSATVAQRRNERRRLNRQKALQKGPDKQLPQRTPEQSLMAGFWYLQNGFITDSAAAFTKATPSPYTREMQTLVGVVNDLTGVDNIATSEKIKFPERPKEVKRKESWDILDQLRVMARLGRAAGLSPTTERRDAALLEALRFADKVIEMPGGPYAECAWFKDFARDCQGDLQQWMAAPYTAPRPLAPITNPFIFAEPLRRKATFMGREAELATVKLAWTSGNLLPILLYGLPQTGKTSLLYVAETANSLVSLAWLNPRTAPSGVASLDQLMTVLREAVRQPSALELASLRTPVTASAAATAGGTGALAAVTVNDSLATTERYVRQVCSLMAPRNLILVVDDFDRSLDTLKTSTSFGQFITLLEHLYETVANFNVVFVTQRHPSVYADRLGRRFMAAATQLSIGCLPPEEVVKLLRQEGLTLCFADEAINAIFELSAGSPFLVQLIAHCVVQRFNRAAARKTGEPLVLKSDVDVCIEDDEFKQRCDAHFTRVWDVLRSSPDAIAQQAETAKYTSGLLWQAWAKEKSAHVA